MSGIPEDIIKDAADALDNALCHDLESHNGSYEDMRSAAISEIAKAILADRQRDQWQNISTAPRDSSDPYICYSPGNPRAHNEYARFPHYHIDGFSERWPRGRNQYPESPYTHWMPLPPAPKGGE